MAAALVKHLGEVDGNGSYATTTTITVASLSVASGNTIVVGISTLDDFGTTQTCADNLGNTYTLVEARDGTYDAALLFAPVISPGTLTSITVTHDSSRYRVAEAAEFSGVGALSTVGAGTATGTGATQTGVVSKDIPAGGLAVWFTGGNVADTYSAGSASGSPSATPVLIDAHNGGANMSGALLYALGGGGGTTGFTGNTTTAGAGTYSNAGGVFAPSVGLPAAPTTFRSIRSLRTLRRSA